jgi:hypothetical protein
VILAVSIGSVRSLTANYPTVAEKWCLVLVNAM